MNAEIVILPQGYPCFVHDDPLPEIKFLELSRADSKVTLVWDDKDAGEMRRKLEFPLEKKITDILEQHKKVAFMRIVDKKAEGLRAVEVKFT